MVRQNGRTLALKAWNFAPRAAELIPAARVDIAFCLEEDPYSAARGYPGWFRGPPRSPPRPKSRGRVALPALLLLVARAFLPGSLILHRPHSLFDRLQRNISTPSGAVFKSANCAR